MFLFIWAAGIFSACSLVDQDMRDCETDYHLDYELRLVTNMTTELETQISTSTETSVSQALEAYLSNIFTDYAHDVDLSFYDVYPDSARLHHESHIMDANQSSYTLYIPVRRYMHLAVANIANSGTVSLQDGEKCPSAVFHQQVSDTLPSHKTGLFSARLPMDIKEGEDQSFDVRLYMSNCATSLVLDTLGSNIRDVRMLATGFATDFLLRDSTYLYRYSPMIKADRLELKEPGYVCFATVNFPSRTEETKTIINTDDPFVSDRAAEALWKMVVYVTTKDGSITETVLGVMRPLLPGQLKIISAVVRPDGGLEVWDQNVGVSIQMDWHPGLDIEIEI